MRHFIWSRYETLVREDGSLENEAELLLLDTSDAEIPMIWKREQNFLTEQETIRSADGCKAD